MCSLCGVIVAGDVYRGLRIKVGSCCFGEMLSFMRCVGDLRICGLSGGDNFALIVFTVWVDLYIVDESYEGRGMGIYNAISS